MLVTRFSVDNSRLGRNSFYDTKTIYFDDPNDPNFVDIQYESLRMTYGADKYYSSMIGFANSAKFKSSEQINSSVVIIKLSEYLWHSSSLNIDFIDS